MGILNKIGLGKGKGHQCSRNAQTGEISCDIFEVQGDQKVSTGTHVSFAMDGNSCEPVMSGEMNSILEDDEEYVKKIADSLRAGCRRGIA